MSTIEVVTSVSRMRTQIQAIIRNARECLYIISPYVKVDNEMKMLLEDKRSDDDIDIRFVYGKKKSLETETKAFLDSMPHIPMLFLKDLHAKCYLNESMALVTSMNLYDYSMIDNVEMGIFVYKDEGFLGLGGNPAVDNLYKEIRDKAESIIKLSEAVDPLTTSDTAGKGRKTTSNRTAVSKASPQAAVAVKGFCIRCGEEIDLDPDKPYCHKDFRIWNRYKDEDYDENFCHLCGKERSTTMAKPVCRPCYKKHVA